MSLIRGRLHFDRDPEEEKPMLPWSASSGDLLETIQR
jgi:hypothetical protein